MNEGYVKIFRRMIDTSFYRNSKMVHFALHCLLRANHKPIKILFNQKEIELQKGEFVSGVHALKKETRLSVQSIRTCVQTLCNIGFLTKRSTNQFTVYRVEKYSFYQFGDGKSTSNLTNHQQTDNKRITTDKNDKNDKNDNKVKNIVISENAKSIANELHKHILINDSKHTIKSSLFKWQEEADKIMRIDERPFEEIINVIRFALTDSFWKSNILSVSKLRKQYSTLLIQMNQKKGVTYGKNQRGNQGSDEQYGKPEILQT